MGLEAVGQGHRKCHALGGSTASPLPRLGSPFASLASHFSLPPPLTLGRKTLLTLQEGGSEQLRPWSKVIDP